MKDGREEKCKISTSRFINTDEKTTATLSISNFGNLLENVQPNYWWYGPISENTFIINEQRTGTINGTSSLKNLRKLLFSFVTEIRIHYIADLILHIIAVLLQLNNYNKQLNIAPIARYQHELSYSWHLHMHIHRKYMNFGEYESWNGGMRETRLVFLNPISYATFTDDDMKSEFYCTNTHLNRSPGI